MGNFPFVFFSTPPFSCSFLLGCLPGSAPCLLPLETPPRSQGWGCGFGLLGAQAVQRLARPCMPSVQPLPHPLGQREGQRMAVWLQVHGESRWPVSQLCLLAVRAQPWVCSPGFRHTLGLCALCSAWSLPAAGLFSLGRSGPQGGGRVPAPTASPAASLSPAMLSALRTSQEVIELCCLAPLRGINSSGCVASREGLAPPCLLQPALSALLFGSKGPIK